MKKTQLQETKRLFPPSLKLDLTSNDAEEMKEQAAFWSYEHKQFSRGKFHGRIVAAHTQRMQISVATRSPGVFIQGAIPAHSTIISIPLSAHHLLHYRGKPMQNYQAIALRDNQELEFLTSAPSTLLTVAVCTDFFDSQAIAITGKPFDELRCQERILLNQNDYYQRAKCLIVLLQKLSLSPPINLQYEQTLIEKKVLEIILSGVRHSGTVSKTPGRLLSAQKTEKLIRKNLKNPLSIAKLSRSVGMSERSLYLGFKERFAVSPKAYTQVMRLNGVQRELLNNSSGRNVSEIAMEWGFFHLGRFSQQYRRMFGESPSKTQVRKL